MGLAYSGSFSLQFKNEHIVYENIIKCTVKEHEMNNSYNRTLVQSGSLGNLKSFATGSDFQPYFTTVGLYDNANNLLAVSKVSQPVQMPNKIDLNIKVRFDT